MPAGLNEASRSVDLTFGSSGFPVTDQQAAAEGATAGGAGNGGKLLQAAKLMQSMHLHPSAAPCWHSRTSNFPHSLSRNAVHGTNITVLPAVSLPLRQVPPAANEVRPQDHIQQGSKWPRVAGDGLVRGCRRCEKAQAAFQPAFQPEAAQRPGGHLPSKSAKPQTQTRRGSAVTRLEGQQLRYTLVLYCQDCRLPTSESIHSRVCLDSVLVDLKMWKPSHVCVHAACSTV